MKKAYQVLLIMLCVSMIALWSAVVVERHRIDTERKAKATIEFIQWHTDDIDPSELRGYDYE